MPAQFDQITTQHLLVHPLGEVDDRDVSTVGAEGQAHQLTGDA